MHCTEECSESDHVQPTWTPTYIPNPNPDCASYLPQSIHLCWHASNRCTVRRRLPLASASSIRNTEHINQWLRCPDVSIKNLLLTIFILPNISRNYRRTSEACTFISNDRKRKAMIIFFRAVASIRINGTSIMYVRIYLALAGPTC